MPEQLAPRTAREIAEHMIRVAAQNVEAMPIREATPRERKILDEEDYDFLLDDVVGEIDNAVITVTWPDTDHHIVGLRANGWTVQHPDGCRPNLFDCPVNLAAERDLVHQPVRLGRFVCALDDDGRFEVGARLLDAPDAEPADLRQEHMDDAALAANDELRKDDRG